MKAEGATARRGLFQENIQILSLKDLKIPLSWLHYMLRSHCQSQLTRAGRRDWESGEEEVGSCCPRCMKEKADRVRL